MTLPDVQSIPDTRGIHIDEVGVSGIRYPVSVFEADGGRQETIASFSLSAYLSAHHKGSHLSRFVEVLDVYGRELTPLSIPKILIALQDRLESRKALIKAAFPFFVRRYAPVSGASALVDYDCDINASIDAENVSIRIATRVPVTSVCPCSKAISDYGAHNQRGYLTISAILAAEYAIDSSPLWMEDLIDAAEASASSPVFPLLKRSDERYVTMAGYDQPVFVEDMVRGVAELLRIDPRISKFSVEAVNDESIHNHGAFARLFWPSNYSEEFGI